MSQDTTGWTVQDDSNEYRGDFNIKKLVGTVQTNVNAIVITNKANGTHTVYEDNGLLEGFGTELYNYNPDGNIVSIGSKADFDAVFTGQNAAQFDTVLKNTKAATIALARDSVQLNDPQSKANLTRLVNTIGFRSLGKNAIETNPNETNQDIQGGSRPTSTSTFPNDKLDTFAPGGTRELLRYPRQSLEAYGYDYIEITAYDYVPSNLDTGKKLKQGFKGSNRRFTRRYETIQLPMQPQLSESTAVSWGGDTLNAIQAAGAQIAQQTITDLGEGNIGEAVSNMVSNTGQAIDKIAGDSGTKAQIAAFFAGQAVGANVLGRTTGQVINPNLELLFTGPNLRSFSFNFTLTPRDPEEAGIVRRMIRAMKRNMTPQRSSEALFLKSPRIFELEYIFGDTNREHPFMNKFKPCACTSFTVNYTPDGSYMTYRGEPSMTSYQISMSFGEIEPIYADEYGGQGRFDEAPTMGF